MAQISYRANLSTAEYPLHPEGMGASVIVAGYDQNLSRYVDSNESRDSSIGIPQLYYAENVLPTKEGLGSVLLRYTDLGYAPQSIGAQALECAREGGGSYAVTLAVFHSWGSGPDSGTAQLCVTVPTPAGAFTRYYVDLATDAPVECNTAQYFRCNISHAQVQGVQYIYIESYGLFILTVTDTGAHLTRAYHTAVEDCIGCVGANGYLLLYTKTAIAWSSTLQLVPEVVARSTAYTLNETVLTPTWPTSREFRYKCTTAGTTADTAPVYPVGAGATVTDGTAVFTAELLDLDFVPSLTTGAGGGEVEELHGRLITAVRSISGFVLYGDQNIVAAVYTNNAQYPYNFRALPNGAGIVHGACVTESAEAGWHYALTKSGMLQVASTGCKLIMPAVMDWLGTRHRTKLQVSNTLYFGEDPSTYEYAAINFVHNRYLCILRGTYLLNGPNYSEILVYDGALDRFGCLSANFVGAVVGLSATQTANSADPVRPLRLVLNTRGPVVITAEVYDGRTVPHDDGVRLVGKAVLGRYRHSRGQLITLQGVTLGAMYNTEQTNSNVRTLVSSDGGVSVTSSPALYEHPVTPSVAQGFRKRYNCRITGTDISLVVFAPFLLNSVELQFTTGGHR